MPESSSVLGPIERFEAHLTRNGDPRRGVSAWGTDVNLLSESLISELLEAFDPRWWSHYFEPTQP